MVIIKRYSNRKLYNTQTKRYITFEEIGSLVKSGNEISIIDHQTEKDLTSIVLAQIILDQEKKQQNQYSKKIFMEFLKNGHSLLQSMINMFCLQYGFSYRVDFEIDQRLRKLIEQREIPSEMGEECLKNIF